MQGNLRFGAVLHAVHYRVPLDGSELHEHRRTRPAFFLLDEFHIVIPQVNILYLSAADLLQTVAQHLVQFFSHFLSILKSILKYSFRLSSIISRTIRSTSGPVPRKRLRGIFIVEPSFFNAMHL